VRVEAVPVVGPSDGVPGPVGRFEVLEDDARFSVTLRRVVPHVEVAFGGARCCAARPLEPRVLRGGVVDDQLGDDPQPTMVGLVEEAAEVVQRAVVGVDACVVGDVVAAVAQGRRVERQEPQRGDTEVLEVAEALGEASEVTDAVAVRVLERAQVHLVDDRVLVPLGVAGERDRPPRALERSHPTPVARIGEPIWYGQQRVRAADASKGPRIALAPAGGLARSRGARPTPAPSWKVAPRARAWCSLRVHGGGRRAIDEGAVS
jgi:hypothetical protein